MARTVELFLVPLNRSFAAPLQVVREEAEMTWVGTLIAPWLLSGTHHYRLRAEGDSATRLLHGESFRGLEHNRRASASLTPAARFERRLRSFR